MNKKLIIGIIIAIVILAIIFLSLNKTGYTTLNKDDKIKIGVMAMVTGPFAYVGENDLQTIELTLEELGYSDKVELIVEDTGQNNNLANTVLAYRKLVDIDEVEVIFNIMTTDGSMVIAPFLEEDKVVVMTPGTGGRQIDYTSEYMFRNGPSDIKAGTQPAKDLYNKLNYDVVAIFTDNSEYTLGITEDFISEYKGNVVINQTLLLNRQDYSTEISKLLNKELDVIMINSQDGLSAGYIVKELNEQNFDLPIFINFFAYNQNSIDIAGSNLFEGIYVYAAEFNEKASYTIEFFEKYKSRYGDYPVVPFHSTGTYDCIKMFLEAIDAVGYDGEKIREYLLENIQDWEGMNGIVSFDERGNTQTGFVLKQVRNGELVLVE